MTDELDTFDFVLAERLHRTIDELSAMPTREYVAWRAYLNYSAAMADFEQARGG